MSEDYKKRTKEEEEKELKEARIRADEKIIIEKRRKEEEKRKNKITNYNEKEREKNKKKYIVKIFYKIPKFAGENEYSYSGEKTKNKLIRINVNDKVQYFNETHPNHLKKGIIRKWEYTNEPNVKFEVIFNDPPFIYEKNNKTGQLYKTKKKIKIIENVPFKKLKKLEGLVDFEIEITKTNILNNSFNLRNALKKEIENKKNMIVKFYEMIIFLKKIKLIHNPEYSLENTNITPKKREEYGNIQFENDQTIKDAFEKIKIKKEFIYEQFIKLNKRLLPKKNIKEVIKAMEELPFLLSIKQFNILFNKDKTDFLKTLENQNIKKNKTMKENAYKLFNDILKSFLKNTNGKYNLTKKDFFINNDIDYYKFINGVMKKESEINDMKFITYEEKFENEIKKFVKGKFVKNDEFYPEKVKIKYTNETTIDKKEFYNNPDKLVEPTDDKVFTINQYNFIPLTQPNDYIEKDGKKIEEKKKIFIIEKIAGDDPGIIKIKLNIDLDVKNLLTNDELINEDKSDSALRMIGDFFGNIGNNLNCDVSRRNFNENLEKVGKLFKGAIASKPEVNKVAHTDNPEVNKIKRISSIQKFTPEISVISSSFEKIKKGGKSLKKNIKSSRNRTLKKRRR